MNGQDQGDERLYWHLVRILANERGIDPSGGGLDDHPELFLEARRLLTEDPEFGYISQVWQGRGRFFPGMEANSLEELRRTATQLRIGQEHPGQAFRYEMLAGTGGVATVLLAFLLDLLDSDSLEDFPLAFQIAFVATAFAVGAFFAWGLVTERSRETFLQLADPDAATHRWWGLLALGGLLALILAFATLGFAGVSELLYLHGLADTTPNRALQHPLDDSALFYVWSFLNSIPVLEIPQTVGWKLDVSFNDRANRVLLLLYKIAVIAPVIATGRLAWKARGVSGPG
jgi:hypothetical protein